MRRALDQFPSRPIADRIWNTYFVPGGKSAAKPFKPVPLHDVADPPELVELCIVANFVEVWLAREGHANPVGINYLEKIQIPHLPSLYGAMLAGVDYVLMGAGIPFRVPGVLDRLAGTKRPAIRSRWPDTPMTRRPSCRSIRARTCPSRCRRSKRPDFLAIVVVARARGGAPQARQRIDRRLRRRRPHRRRAQRPAARQDAAERARRAHLRRARRAPIWPRSAISACRSGSPAATRQPDRLAEARAAGAAGVQVGTAFAFCEESGLRPDYKEDLLAQVRAGTIRVTTDPLASPTSFPFKVAPLAGTVSEAAVYEKRARRLRPRLPARGLPHGDGHRRLPLPGRAGRGVRRQGRGRWPTPSAAGASATRSWPTSGWARRAAAASSPDWSRRATIWPAWGATCPSTAPATRPPTSSPAFSPRPEPAVGRSPAEPPRRSGRLSPW